MLAAIPHPDTHPEAHPLILSPSSELPPAPLPCMTFTVLHEGALATVRAVQTLGTFGDPPADDCNHQEASRKEQKLPRSLWDLLATITKSWEDRSCACNYPPPPPPLS